MIPLWIWESDMVLIACMKVTWDYANCSSLKNTIKNTKTNFWIQNFWIKNFWNTNCGNTNCGTSEVQTSEIQTAEFLKYKLLKYKLRNFWSTNFWSTNCRTSEVQTSEIQTAELLKYKLLKYKLLKYKLLKYKLLKYKLLKYKLLKYKLLNYKLRYYKQQKVEVWSISFAKNKWGILVEVSALYLLQIIFQNSWCQSDLCCNVRSARSPESESASLSQKENFQNGLKPDSSESVLDN